jgi:1,4-dihydroxy-2-naphthoate octaprenyltransferase
MALTAFIAVVLAHFHLSLHPTCLAALLAALPTIQACRVCLRAPTPPASVPAIPLSIMAHHTVAGLLIAALLL